MIIYKISIEICKLKLGKFPLWEKTDKVNGVMKRIYDWSNSQLIGVPERQAKKKKKEKK